MAQEFLLSVVAPDKIVFEDRVTSIVAPGVTGYFGVQAGHIPLIAALRPGLLEYTDSNNQRHYVYVGGGFLQVRGEQTTILADEAERAKDIDVAKAEEHLESARRALRGESSLSSTDDAVIEVERAMNRLKAARAAK